MSATLHFRGKTATVERGVWSGDPYFARIAHALSLAERHAPGYVPDRDYALAQAAARWLKGAEVTAPPLPEVDELRVY